MSGYKLYCIDGAGKISAAPEIIEAKNDGEALILARAKKLGVPCELWAGNRLVAKIPANGAP